MEMPEWLARLIAVLQALIPGGLWCAWWLWGVNWKKTWPVLYSLHGGHDTYVSWTRSTDIAQVAAGYNAMVVMPETRPAAAES